MERVNCSDCFFIIEGFCHLNPPQVHVVMAMSSPLEQKAKLQQVSFYPPVDGAVGCGFFKNKEEGNVH